MKKSRIMAWLLIAMLCISAPMTALAEGEDPKASGASSAVVPEADTLEAAAATEGEAANAGNSGQEEAVEPDSGTQILPETQPVSETAEAADAEGTDGEADASSPWQAEDFTYGMIEHTLSGCNYTREIQVQGTGILGLSDSGKEKIQVNKHLVLPGKAPSGETVVGVGPNAFAKMGIETITFPEDMMIPYDDTVTHTITRRGNFIIKSGAFSDNNLTAMDFPEGILFIDAAAFKNNRMTEVRFPHTLWMIGNQAFASNSLRQVQLPVTCDFQFQIDNMAFADNQIRSVTLPDYTEKVFMYSFFKNPGMEEIPAEAPDKVKAEGAGVVYMYTNNDALFQLDRIHHLGRTAANQKSWVQKLIKGEDTQTVWGIRDFTYEGNTVTGLSESGIQKRAKNKNLILPSRTDTGEVVKAVGKGGTIGAFVTAEEGFDSVEIPDTVETIGDKAFHSSALKSVVIPNSVTSIGIQAFSNNQLKKVTLPDSVTTLGGAAFSDNRMLAEVQISAGLTELMPTVFGLTGNNVSNENLKTVIIPKGIRKIGRGAFGGQAIETLSLPEGLQEIDASAFKGNHLSSLALPGTVTKVGNSAFEQGGAGGFLTSLFLSDGLKEIGSKAFARGALTRVDLPYGLQKMNKLAFDGNQTVPVPAYTPNEEAHKPLEVAGATFTIKKAEDVWTVNDFTYDEAGTTITGFSESGHAKKTSMDTLIFPNQNTKGEDIIAIGDGAAGGGSLFAGEGVAFKKVILPVHLIRIGKFAFVDAGIESVAFPSTLTSIDMRAFAQNKIREVVLPDSVTTLGAAAFGSNDTLEKVVISRGMKEIPASAFVNNTPVKTFTSVTIPEGIESIGNFAFSGNGFTTLTLPSTVKKIGDNAFAQGDCCSSLKEVFLPEGLTEIGKKAFKDTLLTQIDIPAGLQKLAKDTFSNQKGTVVKVRTTNEAHLKDNGRIFYASSQYHKVVYDKLTGTGWSNEDFTYEGGTVTGWSQQGHKTRKRCLDLVLPEVNPETQEPITRIGAGAFQIPEGEWEQGKSGIYSPNGMKTVKLPDTLQAIEESAFQYNSLEKVEFPASLTEIGKQAFHSNKLKAVVLPDTVKTIKEGAFSVNEIVDLTLSRGLTKIPQAAFSMNINLTHVTLPDTITEIDDFAFAGARLETLEIPASVVRIGRKAFHLHHLTQLRIPGTVKEIGESAFEGTFKFLSLRELILEEGIETIGTNAFKEGYLETVQLPSSLKFLAESVFPNNAGVNG
ncbi:leucine-rich repeat domain-containing protein, partial [Suipraeoptans intestinalis]|uniref:leucine-rich repeat domain-containing protein n=1 Tax=Suipraeoptans intestinalis TaxID=2606628 RepID=UPI0023F151DC